MRNLVGRLIYNSTTFLLVCGFALGQASSGSIDQEWRSYGHDPGGMRFSPLKQISRANVHQLQRAWTYHTGETSWSSIQRGGPIAAFETTPLMVDGVLYFTTPASRVIALEAETGKEIWIFDPFPSDIGTRRTLQNRGAAYWQGSSPLTCGGATNGVDKRIFYATVDARLFALDPQTGKPCQGFGNGGTINLRADVADRWPKGTYEATSPPAVYKDLVITGAGLQEHPSKGPSGAVRAFDVRTGKLVWRFDTVPRPGEVGHDTWEGDSWKDRSGTNVWSIMSVDSEHGLVFLPVGSASYDFYGADRKGMDLFSNSLVALDAATGRLTWYYQMVHHDIWDYDMPAQPVMITLRRDGREIPAVTQVTKMGFVFILDRLTGKPLFPVEERRVPESNVPGEASWPTQPFPLKPPPLVRQTFSQADVSEVTKESHQYCEELARSLKNRGMYTPYGTELTLVMPGTLGGGNWSGASFDRASGYLFVNANELGAVGAMQPQAAGAPMRYRRGAKDGEYARFWDENQWPCQKPPWGTLNAVDVNKGEIVWKVPLGSVDEMKEKTGTPNLGGSIVTASGLVFIGATIDNRFRAFDAKTGEQLWVTNLEASAHATPVTYMGKKTGKQFVVIAAGGGGYFRGKVSDTLAAFTLPDE